jgi:hypothetical protein
MDFCCQGFHDCIALLALLRKTGMSEFRCRGFCPGLGADVFWTGDMGEVTSLAFLCQHASATAENGISRKMG